MTVEQKVTSFEGRQAAAPAGGPTEPAGRPAGAEGYPGGDSFDGMIEGFPDSFWEGVSRGMIEQPELMDWNQWQSWRSSEGGLPRGARDRDAQKRESSLWQAAMVEYYGMDYKTQLKKKKEDEKKLREQRVEAQVVARKLFSSAEVGSTGTSRSATDSSPLLNRSNRLLPSLEAYPKFVEDMNSVLLRGSIAWPQTFTAEFMHKVRLKTCLLYTSPSPRDS